MPLAEVEDGEWVLPVLRSGAHLLRDVQLWAEILILDSLSLRAHDLAVNCQAVLARAEAQTGLPGVTGT